MTDGLPNSSCPSIPGPSTLYICEWGHCTHVMNDRRWIKHIAIISRQTLQVPVWCEQEKFIIQLSGGGFFFLSLSPVAFSIYLPIYKSHSESAALDMCQPGEFMHIWTDVEKKGEKKQWREKVTREQPQRWRQQVQDLLFG